MSDVSIEIDANNRDVLFCRRAEMFFVPNEDGTPSVNGRIVWHTEWWHYSGDIKRAQSTAPRIERRVEDIITDDYGGIPAHVLVAAIKAAFIKHARQDLGLDTQEEPEE